MTGVVAEFDEQKGYGTIQAEDGVGYFFHCTQIADGSRSIPTGAEVSFDVVPGRLGRWEAVRLRPAT